MNELEFWEEEYDLLKSVFPFSQLTEDTDSCNDEQDYLEEGFIDAYKTNSRRIKLVYKRGSTINGKKPPSKPNEQFCMILKAHHYDELLKMVDYVEYPEDIDYLRRDINTMNLDKIADRIDNVRKYGKCDKTNSYYKGIQVFIDNGITRKDVELYQKWINDVYKKKLSQKLKELKATNESVIYNF